MKNNLDIPRVQEILNRYRKSAIDKNNIKAQNDVEHIMKAVNKLWSDYCKDEPGEPVKP